MADTASLSGRVRRAMACARLPRTSGELRADRFSATVCAATPRRCARLSVCAWHKHARANASRDRRRRLARSPVSVERPPPAPAPAADPVCRARRPPRRHACSNSARSIVSGRILKPPRTMAPSARPRWNMKPSASIAAMSEVRIHSVPMRGTFTSRSPSAPAGRISPVSGSSTRSSAPAIGRPTLPNFCWPHWACNSADIAVTGPANSVAP